MGASLRWVLHSLRQALRETRVQHWSCCSHELLNATCSQAPKDTLHVCYHIAATTCPRLHGSKPHTRRVAVMQHQQVSSNAATDALLQAAQAGLSLCGVEFSCIPWLHLRPSCLPG